jgi:hypothetical protein
MILTHTRIDIQYEKHINLYFFYINLYFFYINLYFFILYIMSATEVKSLEKLNKESIAISVVGIVLLIIGMVLVLYNNDKYTEDQKSNKKTGIIMMSIGGGLMGLVLLYIIYQRTRTVKTG